MMAVIFTGDVRGLEKGSKFYVLRFHDGRRDGYKHGYSRTPYIVTKRGEDRVEAEEGMIRMDDEPLIFDGVDIGEQTKLTSRQG